jgi:hypothetical protein
VVDEAASALASPSKPQKLTVDEARELMRTQVAALLRVMSVREVIGLEEYSRFAGGKTAMKRLEDAKYWVAREIENLA